MKKKLLFINGHLNVGGVEKSLVDLLRHMDYNKYDVELLLLEEFGDYKPEIPEEVKIKLVSLKNTYGAIVPCLWNCIKKRDFFSLKMRFIMLMTKFGGQRFFRLARKLLTDNYHYDCVIGFRSGICSQIAAFGVNADKRIVWWHHGEFDVSVREYLEIAKRCDSVVAVSKSCSDMLRENIPSLESKLKVIPNMIDKEQLEQKCLTSTPYEDNEQNWVTVCRISKEKHIENVIYSAHELKKQGVQFQWHIVGDGILKEEMEQLAIKYEVQNCVFFEGSKQNPYPYMKYANLYIHPSYVESQGLTILEAMTLGIPCVVTKSRGPCEFIRDSFNGILVEQSYMALVEGIKRILQEKKLYESITNNLVCLNEFQPKQVMCQIETLIDDK